MATLTIKLMGLFRVDIDGHPVTNFKTNKVRGLLAYLVVEAKQPQRREALAGMFWPEYTEQRARANLSQALFMLRQSIGDETADLPTFIVKRDTIRLNPAADLWLDVDAFTTGVATNKRAATREMVRELETAVALYEGEFMEGFSLSGSSPFEMWCLSLRERLHRLLSKALTHLTSFYERESEYENSLQYGWRLQELDSWREEAHVAVMRLLALTDRRSEAMAQYDVCRRVLAENLGIAPMRQTTELYEAIRDGQFGKGVLLESVTLTAPSFLAAKQPPPPSRICVGRDQELARLDRFLSSALQGQGQVAFVTGEAGSGKTVLWQEFTRQAIAQYPELLVAAGKGTAYTGLGDPYAAFREIASQLSGNVATRWTAGTISRTQALRLWRALPFAVQALVNSAPDLVGSFVNGANLLERTADFTEEAQLDGAQIRWLVQLEKLVARRKSGSGLSIAHQSALFEQFMRFLSDMARQAPLLLVLDDLQWADVGTISLLFHISRNLIGQRILLLGAFRPEEIAVVQDGKRHPLAPVVHEMERDFGDVVLELGQEADPSFVEALVDSEPNTLDASFRMKLFQQTGGHPLYTAELLRGLQERGDLYRNQEGQWAAGKDLDWDTIPPRVEGIIAERIGRLPPSLQHLLQAASVQGESFSAEIAAAALQVDEDEALSALSGVIGRDHRLVRAQSVERASDGESRLSIYQFHHFLFQKYLYNSLDRIERARLHEDTGETMALLFGDQVSAMSVQLARHFEVAGIVDRAAYYRLQAGNYAIKLLALEEAIDHFSKGLALLDTCDETPERSRLEMTLQLGLGTGYQLLGGYGSTAAQRAYSRARDLCLKEGESPQLVAALWPLATYETMIGDIPQGVKLAEQALSVARRVEDPLFICVAHHHLGWILYERGRFLESVKHQEETIAMYDRRYHEAMVQMFGHDFGVTSLGWIAWPLCYLGYPDQALQRGHEAIALAQSFDHPFSILHAYNMTALVHVQRSELTKAGEFVERIEQLATTYGFASYKAAANTFLGYGLIGQGQIAEGIAILRKGLLIFEAGGVSLYHRGTLAFIAERCASMGQIELGNKALAEADALRFIDRNSGPIEYARGLLLKAQEAAAEEVEACFLRAIEIAYQRQAKSSELKATTSLCRLWQEQGRKEEAREKLAAMYNWFTEGFDTADLQAAAALLDELA